MPADAFFNSVTAARLYGAPLSQLLEASNSLHVARPVPAAAVAVRGIAGHQVALMGDDTRLYRGIRVSSPVRTWCEVAQVLSLPDLVAVGDFFVHWRLPLATIADLREGIAKYPGRRGRRKLDSAIGMLSDQAESRRESLFRVFLIQRGFNGFAPNYRVTVHGYKHRIDIAFPALMVAFEYQSEYHFSDKQKRKDMTRRSRLEAAGWHVMEINVDDFNDPVELEARIRAFLALWS
jgi:very-short-patch-repair endonuclease